MDKIAWSLAGALLVSACVTAMTSVPAVAEPAANAATSAAQTRMEPGLRRGRLAQGGLSFWQTEPGSEVYIDKKPVQVDQDGHFVLGFERDFQGSAELYVVFPDGEDYRRLIPVEEREFNISRITIEDVSKVNPYTEEQLAQIRRETAKKAEARKERLKTSYWRAGFDWPVRARISSKYGNQRIVNGTPKRFHSGTDIAAPEGTPIYAPSHGKVTLAESDFYFEGGVIFIDHGQEVETVVMHLSKVLVKPGQIVSKGEVIGAVGSTGRSTGPHLHWTINWKGKPMDPELIMPPMIVND